MIKVNWTIVFNPYSYDAVQLALLAYTVKDTGRWRRQRFWSSKFIYRPNSDTLFLDETSFSDIIASSYKGIYNIIDKSCDSGVKSFNLWKTLVQSLYRK